MERSLIKSDLELRIFTVRDLQVIIDRDLALIYGVQTKRLVEQVKRNIERFPSTFMIQLTLEEASRSQIATLNQSSKKQGMNIKYRPYAFTEQGVAMLSGVLRTPTAIETSIFIMETFVALRKKMPNTFENSHMINHVHSKIIEHDVKISEILKKIDSFDVPKSGIFFDNQIFDAYVFSSELISKAWESIILIDNYIDENTLLQLSKRRPKANCTIYTEKISAQLKLDLEKHNAQYSPIEIRILKKSHDRFLILDNKELYHLGASLKDLGKRWFAFSRMDGLVSDILCKL